MPDFKDITFDNFYKLYPRKEKKPYAERCFKKLSIKDRFDAYNGLINYIKFWKASETEKQFIPHPSSFINGRRWEDEVELPKAKKEFKLDATGRFFIAYCSNINCNTGSDFYNDYEIKGDSRCCKAELLPERKQWKKQ